MVQLAAIRRRKNRVSMRDLQSCATPSNPQLLTRNEQVSGSSPLVGLLFYDHLKEKR